MAIKPSICVFISLYLILVYPVVSVLAEPEEHHEVDPKSGEFWGQIVAIFFLVVLSGIVAGKKTNNIVSKKKHVTYLYCIRFNAWIGKIVHIFSLHN